MHNKENSWRNFQAEYIVQGKNRKHYLRPFLRIGSIFLCVAAILSAGWFIGPDLLKKFHSTESPPADQSVPEPPESDARQQISVNELGRLIATVPFNRTDKNVLFIDSGGEQYRITTSIDIYLQEYLLSLMADLKKKNRGKPQRIALVVMEAQTGKIIAMAGFDLDDPDVNPCIKSDYPAASLFKIVTAAAAVETLGYQPQTQLYFNGNKYTLYKRQLRETKNKYSYKISFASAFAESINPVFGKLGKNHLGGNRLKQFADAFGFNQIIETEIPFVTGSFDASGSDYHLAELGCGFNNKTTISPMFGAMMAAAIVNSGNLMVPSIVEHVTDSSGEIIYKNEKSTYKTAIRPETAAVMIPMMERTVSRGTARKAFRGASRDPVLSRLTIGGKTGSLYNTAHTVKYDWFTGFAAEKSGQAKITMSIVVGHRKYIGTRAGTYAKMILKQHFKHNDNTTMQ